MTIDKPLEHGAIDPDVSRKMEDLYQTSVHLFDDTNSNYRNATKAVSQKQLLDAAVDLRRSDPERKAAEFLGEHFKQLVDGKSLDIGDLQKATRALDVHSSFDPLKEQTATVSSAAGFAASMLDCAVAGAMMFAADEATNIAAGAVILLGGPASFVVVAGLVALYMSAPPKREKYYKEATEHLQRNGFADAVRDWSPAKQQ
jgi:hypothetical protein